MLRCFQCAARLWPAHSEENGGKEHTIVSENKIEEARTFSIYQMKSGEETKAFRFEGIDCLEKHNIMLSLSMYDNVYEGTLPTNATLDNIYEEFNVNPPADFKGHSLSVSDVFVVEHNGIPTAHYIDRIGFEYVATLSEEIAAERQGEVPKITDHYADSILHDNDIDADREKPREQLGFKDATSQQPQEKISVKERFNAAKEESARRNTEYKANNGKLQMDKEEL